MRYTREQQDLDQLTQILFNLVYAEFEGDNAFNIYNLENKEGIIRNCLKELQKIKIKKIEQKDLNYYYYFLDKKYDIISRKAEKYYRHNFSNNINFDNKVFDEIVSGINSQQKRKEKQILKGSLLHFILK